MDKKQVIDQIRKNSLETMLCYRKPTKLSLFENSTSLELFQHEIYKQINELDPCNKKNKKKYQKLVEMTQLITKLKNHSIEMLDMLDK